MFRATSDTVKVRLKIIFACVLLASVMKMANKITFINVAKKDETAEGVFYSLLFWETHWLSSSYWL